MHNEYQQGTLQACINKYMSIYVFVTGKFRPYYIFELLLAYINRLRSNHDTCTWPLKTSFDGLSEKSIELDVPEYLLHLYKLVVNVICPYVFNRDIM